MDAVSSATAQASSANLGSVQGAAAVSVLKKALDLQAASSVQLIESLPQPPLASSGSVGTRVNTYA